MAIRAAYNDPTLGAAFNNIASMFAPPSGSDLAGYATANAKNQEAQRLAQLYNDAGLSDFDQTVFDRQAIATGLYNPTQSFYAQDQNNSTARYGIDTTSATSITNNTADNERALMEAIIGAATDPVSQDAARPGFNPADFGVAAPAVAPFAGPRSPLSETQVMGGIIGGLPEADQTALALSDIPVEQVIMGDGPQFVRRPDAVGLTPYDKPTGATETQNYQTPATVDPVTGVTVPGKNGSAYFDPAVKDWRDTATGERLPANSVTYSAGLTGDSAGTGLNPTTSNLTASNSLEATLNAMDADIANLQGLLNSNPGIAGLPGAIFGTAQDAASVAGEFAAAFGQMAPDAALTAEQVQRAAQAITPNRNPAIMQYNMGIANLAYRLAQMNNPSGEVSRQAYERSLESLQGGMFANNQSSLEALDALSQQVSRNRETQLQTLRNPGQGAAPSPPTPPAPAVPEEGMEIENPNTGERRVLRNGQWEPI